MISVVARRVVARSLRPTTTSLSSGMKLNYVREQSVVDFSGVLNDGGRLSGSALAELLALRVCSCEAAHFRGPLAL
jgi:hypothetical protein